LHSWRISFRHPSTGQPLTLSAPLPHDLLGALEQAGIQPPA
jgi:hypothetical protein